ncbi:hypothetical protein ATANTOWER_010992 [Ataeniobius toweri]|uniref:Uncharacterized protein n=1 Tax=Ataeniobius toweri TaxID=208326 RepID=A0ABU7AZS3_9TELE|nr:hypothetical protein [Ataeniobius toweri]
MWNQTTNIATIISYLPHSLMHQLPPDIISMIMVVREVMNLSSNQLMSIIGVIIQISHKLSLLYLFPNKHRSNTNTRNTNHQHQNRPSSIQLHRDLEVEWPFFWY